LGRKRLICLTPAVVGAGSSVAAVALTAAALEGALKGALEVVSCSGRLRIFADCLRLFADCSLAMTKWNEGLYV